MTTEELSAMPAAFLLELSLSAAVPLRIAEYVKRGGPTDDDRRRTREFAPTLGAKGDILQYRGAKKGETAAVFNQLADALAVLAFCPGGVRFGGSHYIAKSGGECAATDAVR